jgi:endo-1,4-beta-xylanase
MEILEKVVLMNRRAFLTAATATLGLTALDSVNAASLIDAEQPTLKQLAVGCGIRIGVAGSKHGLSGAAPEFLRFLSANFNLFTPEGELKWSAIRPTQNTYDFSGADWILEFAKQNGFAVRGHNLCWNTGNPPWVEQVVKKSNAEKILVDHISTVARRYAGKLDSWDVVNEPIALWFNKPGGYYAGPWLDALGPEYIDVAFHATAVADPETLRVINVHHIEQASDEEARHACLNMLEALLKRKVPVQALGIESHLDCNLTIDQARLDKFIATVRGMGLEILITELDINDSTVKGDNQHRDQVVADYYRRYLDVVLPVANLKRLLFWAPADHSWMDYMCNTPRWQRADGNCNHRPGLIDSQMQIKPSYNAVAASLANNFKSQPETR